MKTFFNSVIATLILLLSGCGGGDKSAETQYSLSVSETNVQFSTPYNIQEDNLSRELTINFTGEGLIVGYPPGVDEPNWLEIRHIDSTTTSAKVILIINGLTLDKPLTDKTTVRFITGKADGSVVKTVDVAVSYNRTDIVAFSDAIVTPVAAKEEQVTGTYTLGVNSYQGSWSLSNDVDWLDLDTNAGVGTANVIATINDNANTLAIGEHKATFSLFDDQAKVKATKEVSVFIDAKRTWVNHSTVHLVHYANINSDNKTVNVFSHEENFNAADLQFFSDANWLTAQANSDSQITLTSNEQNLPVGEYTATLTITGAKNAVKPIHVQLTKVASNISESIVSDNVEVGDFSRAFIDTFRNVTYWFDNNTNELLIKNSLLATNERISLPDAELNILSENDFDNSIYNTYGYQISDNDNLVMQIKPYISQNEEFSIYHFDRFTKQWAAKQTRENNFYESSFYFDGVHLTLRQDQIEYSTFSTNFEDFYSGKMYTFSCGDSYCYNLNQHQKAQGNFIVDVTINNGTGEATDRVSHVTINQEASIITLKKVSSRERQCPDVRSLYFQVLGNSVISCGSLFTVSATGELSEPVALDMPDVSENSRLLNAELLDAAVNNKGELVALWALSNTSNDIATSTYNIQGTLLKESKLVFPELWQSETHSLRLSEDGQRVTSRSSISSDGNATASIYIEAVE